MNRRQFVLAGMASFGAVPILASVSNHVASTRGGAALDPYAILYDTRFADSRAFGAEVARNGGPARAIDGDITRLWFEELAPRWQRGEGTVAGMTTGRTLLCLERLAWDHGLRGTMPVPRRSLGHANTLVSWIIAP